MKWRNVHIACLALLLAVPRPTVLVAQATPAYMLTVAPASPTTKDVLTLKLAGIWPDNCPPNKLKVTLQDTSINIDMLLPGAEDGQTSISKAIKTAWQATATIGPLAAGTYRIYARGVSATQTGGYVKLAEIQVQAASAAPTDPNTGGGHKSDVPKPTPDPNGTKSPSTTPGPKPDDLAAPDGMENLVLGVTIILMDDSLIKECGLGPGQCGTIVACEGPGHAGMVLITWHFFGRGVSDACQDEEGTPVGYLMDSARWVDTKVVRLATCIDLCGTLDKGQGYDILFRAEDGCVYNLIDANSLNEPIAPPGRFHVGDYVRVRGLLQVAGPRTDWASVRSRQHGDIYCPILTLWEPPEPKGSNCCPGDKLIVDLGHNQVRLYRDPRCPGGKHNLCGVTTMGVTSTRRALLSVKVKPYSGVDGTWKASLSVDEVNANQWTDVRVYVDVDGIDLSNLPAGEDAVVATVTFDSIQQ